jgi:glycosyltransferase involved in cell wall biosynthesis
MRILHITKKYPKALGGDATGSSNLEREQTLAGNKVFILTTNCIETIDKPNVYKFGFKDKAQNFDHINIKRLISLAYLFFYSFFVIKKIKPDVVHSHSADLGWAFILPCKFYRIPVINQCRGVSFPYPETNSYKGWLEKMILKYAGFDEIVTVDVNTLPAFHAASIKNVVYIPNGVNINRFTPNHVNHHSKRVEFLFVGRLEKLKGLNYLIEAVDRLKNSKYNFVINMVGNGSLMKDLKETIRKKNLEEYFAFHGEKTSEEIISWYNKSDVFVSPAIWEGFPNTLLEAWASGLPVIITNVGGISKICTNNQDALVIPSKDSVKLAEAIEKMLRDTKLREKLSKNGRKKVETNYTWKIVSDIFIKLYGDLIEHN